MEDGYPAGSRPSAAAFDPATRVLWVGTEGAELFGLSVDAGRWDRRLTPGIGPVRAVVPFGGAGGIAVRGALGWYALDEAGGARPLARESLPPEVLRAALPPEERLALEDPAFPSVAGTLTLDRFHRRWRISGFVPDDRRGRYWIGTEGGNLLLYDSRTLAAEPRPFGLLAEGVSALEADGGGIWFAGDGRGPRRGVTWGRADLQEWRLHEASLTGAPPGPVRRIAVTAEGVWFAAPDGLFRYLRGEDRWERWTDREGLPATEVLAVLGRRDGGVWAGTSRGVARVGPGGTVEGVLLPGAAAAALLRRGDTLWVGGPFGVVRVTPDGRGAPLLGPDGAGPFGGVEDLAFADGELWALTGGALWRWTGGRWLGPDREVALELGRLGRIRVGGRRLWVAGAGGIARLDPELGGWRYYRAGGTFPRGPVVDVLPGGGVVHGATPEGAWRIEWSRAP